ncbi:MAG TPA: tRNA (N(6)-L-threonylcarbamoyladenosine(37)-C(2))-methylthiotransferase MtaB [Acidobacteriaceae bacterium]|nr:tRNA (N(6)-L-threonylcarbamoyladenosine(37)-C(2))-methylthiotransferase MtaB [Acidobacteriaceae bacterium]
MAGYHVENFGCRASRFDGEAIAANLRHRGLAAAEAQDSAHVVIVNTCSVTAEADRQARAYLRRVRRQNPDARIVVTGCYAQRAPEELAALPEVDAVVGNSHKSKVADVALAFALAASPTTPGIRDSFVPLSALVPRVLHDDAFAHFDLAALPFAPDAQQTRPNLKVQDGCGNRCSFCIIPTTRGPSRSVPLATCLDNVRRFVDQEESACGGGKESARGGSKELVLSGINLGRWGRDLQPTQRFEDLVAAILRTTALPRLRLSSIEPMDWSPDLLALYREYAAGASSAPLNAERCALSARLPPAPCTPHPRLARHAHLPLQSGSDAILRRMHRRYRPWHYAERLAAIRALLPDAAIGADVMIGFPGETDALFQESYDFIAAQPFTYLHLFPFSARPGTPAWELHRQQPVPPRAVQERLAALRALMADKFRAFRQPFIGRTLSSVTMETGADGTTDAMSDNFLRLSLTTPGGAPIPDNRLVAARITALTPDGLAGTLASPESASASIH